MASCTEPSDAPMSIPFAEGLNPARAQERMNPPQPQRKAFQTAEGFACDLRGARRRKSRGEASGPSAARLFSAFLRLCVTTSVIPAQAGTGAAVSMDAPAEAEQTYTRGSSPVADW